MRENHEEREIDGRRSNSSVRQTLIGNWLVLGLKCDLLATVMMVGSVLTGIMVQLEKLLILTRAG